jgi:hypothetical protein
MVWGFGPWAVGPARVEKMLGTKNAEAIVGDIVARGRTATLEDAFSGLFKSNGRGLLYGLGTAYGTKLLHVAGHKRPHGSAPLVYDVRVWRSLSTLKTYPYHTPKPSGWVGSVDYADYCRWASTFAQTATEVIDDLRTASDVEYALFSLGDRRANR